MSGARVAFWAGCVALLAAGLVGLGMTTPVPSVDGPAAVSSTSTPAAASEAATAPAEAVQAASPSAAPLAAPASEAAAAPADTPDWTYAPCDWFANGHGIPAYTHADECIAADGSRVPAPSAS